MAEKSSAFHTESSIPGKSLLDNLYSLPSLAVFTQWEHKKKYKQIFYFFTVSLPGSTQV